MKATTIKLEGPLLKAIETSKPKSESISSFVRRIIEKSIRQDRMIEAGSAYKKFLTANPEESSWLVDWEDADLDGGFETAR
ncbi:MAG: hypothetical protein EA369_04950 [Bradymonadales bacterium]|nr:MAG: hypothetical protein EA369_04950 [Bradymonadales bacterium]